MPRAARFLALFTCVPRTHATSPSIAPLKIGIYVSSPFVMQTATGYTGMAIDLWQDTAAKLGQYVPLPPSQTCSRPSAPARWTSPSATLPSPRTACS
jgi:hypothetical protein